MGYLSLYRKWRPQTFSDVAGQPHIVLTLQNSLKLDRVSHAYLFTGPRGTGKTTVARLMAKGLNCQNGPTENPCGVCEACTEIAGGHFLDVIEVDGASNRGIEEIRELREQVRYTPSEGRYKVYIIDEVHMLTTEAFNALLKTLEEPPEYVVFIFATTDPQKIPATILSRCQRFDFHRFTTEQICTRLNMVLQGEEIKADSLALELIAKHSEGGMRDALGILDQCIAYSPEVTQSMVTEILGVVDRDVLSQFVQALADKDSANALITIESLYDQGKDLAQFVRDVIEHLRQLVSRPDESWDLPNLLVAIEEFSQCERDLRYAFDVKIPLELTVLRFVDMPSAWGQLKSKVEFLEKRITELEVNGVKGPPGGNATIEDSATGARIRMTDDDQEKLDHIAANWNGYLQALRDERLVQPEAFLREGTPIRLQDDVLVIGFAKARGFHKASIEQDKHKEPAERILSRYFGAQLQVKCVSHDQSGPKKSESPEAVPENVKPPDTSKSARGLPSANPSDQGEELDGAVQTALKMFGGKVVKVSDTKKGGELDEHAKNDEAGSKDAGGHG